MRLTARATPPCPPSTAVLLQNAPSDGRLSVPSIWRARALSYSDRTWSCGAHIGEAMPMSTPKGSRT